MAQSERIVALLIKWRDDGLGWEDAHVLLRRRGIKMPRDHVRMFFVPALAPRKLDRRRRYV